MELRLPLEMSPGREAACLAVFGTWDFFRTMHGKTAPSCLLPHIPPAHLEHLYEESREISDDLNDYFRSQKFANKADVITRSDEIKEYLAETYPWMAPDTLENTYNYFFLGIGNG